MKSNRSPGAALSAILQDKGRSALIVLTLALCMGCFLVMRAFGSGGEEQFVASLSTGDPEEIGVTPGDSGIALNDAAVGAFKGIEGVEATTGVIELPLRIRIGGYEAEDVKVLAVDAEALRGRLTFSSGGMFAEQTDSPQIVLGYRAQMDFQNDNAPAAQNTGSGGTQGGAPTPPPVNWFGQHAQVSFAGGSKTDESEPVRLYTGSVAGILKEDSSDRNAQAFMSLTAARKLLRENYGEASALGFSANAYEKAYVFVKDIGKVQAVLDSLTRMGYVAQSAVADLDNLQKELSLQQALLAVIEIFSVLTAILSVLCIALSCRSAQGKGMDGPLAARMAGSAALGLMGGLAAVLIACFFALIANTSSAETILFGMHFGQRANLVIPPGAALETFCVAIIISVFFGWVSYKRTNVAG